MPEDRTCHTHRCENLKFYVVIILRYGQVHAPTEISKGKRCRTSGKVDNSLPQRCEKGNNLNCIKILHGLSPRANYTDRVTAACRRSDCQLVRIEGATWSA
jgi:hypothetical protein